MKLTPAQQQMVENNHNLIYMFLKKHSLPIEEYYGVAAIGLCKAVITFDESKNIKFSTYACRVMYNEVGMLWRKEAKCVKPSCSLNEPIGTDKDTSELTLADAIVDPHDHSLDVITVSSITSMLKQHKELYATVFSLVCSGYTQREIGAKLNVTQSSVSLYVRQIKKIIKEIL